MLKREKNYHGKKMRASGSPEGPGFHFCHKCLYPTLLGTDNIEIGMELGIDKGRRVVTCAQGLRFQKWSPKCFFITGEMLPTLPTPEFPA